MELDLDEIGSLHCQKSWNRSPNYDRGLLYLYYIYNYYIYIYYIYTRIYKYILRFAKFLWGFSIHAEFLLGGSSLLPTYSERQDSRRTGHVERLGRNSTLGENRCPRAKSYKDLRYWGQQDLLSDIVKVFVYTCIRQVLFWKTGRPPASPNRSQILSCHVGSLQQPAQMRRALWEDQRKPPWRISFCRPTMPFTYPTCRCLLCIDCHNYHTLCTQVLICFSTKLPFGSFWRLCHLFEPGISLEYRTESSRSYSSV